MLLSRVVKKASWFIVLSLLFISSFCVGCSAEVQNSNSAYELYPTENMYNFLKLNTSDGRITQVQYGINNDGARFECSLNSLPLVDASQAQNGRFKLYPTQNIYTFLLLDTINGRTWQVQWSIDEDRRGIVGEIK